MRKGITVAGLILVSVFFFALPSLTFNEEIIFVGIPRMKLVTNPPSKTDPINPLTPRRLKESESPGYLCVISKIGDKYYHKSREDKELTMSRSGTFITFNRADGMPDYVRLWDTTWPLAPNRESDRFQYVEVVTQFLSSITYWGEITNPPDFRLWKSSIPQGNDWK